MARIVLASSLMGKTYADKTYKNVYDFDKHTLTAKYNREDYPHLTDEEFKGMPGRKTKKNWLHQYMEDFKSTIEMGGYDVVLGWLQKDVVREVLSMGYKPEIVMFDKNIDPRVLFERARERGNRYSSVESVEQLIQNIYSTFSTDYYAEYFDVWIAHKPIYLSDFLVSTGSRLYRYDGGIDQLFEKLHG